MNIQEYMTHDHRECDEELAEVESLVGEGDFEKAAAKYQEFKAHMLKHFAQEEELLFVEFTNATGMSGGPVEVMKYEHSQMRGLLEQLAGALEHRNKDEFLGISDALMVLIQQHNMKEEQMLYRMIQMHLGARNDELVGKLQEF